MKKLTVTMLAACAVTFATFAAQCAAKTEDGVQCKHQAEEFRWYRKVTAQALTEAKNKLRKLGREK